MHDAEFTCALFRFIQLTCEGHNLGEFFLLFLLYMDTYSIVFNIRMAKLSTYPSRKYHDCERRHLHRRLLASAPRIHYGLLLALLQQRAD